MARWLCGSLALALLLGTLVGPVGEYSERLFWVHMVRHLTLIMVVPVLLVWARPPLPHRSPGGPVVALAGYTATVVLTHLTGFQQASLASGWVRAGELVLYLVVGWWYFRPLVDLHPGLPHLLRFLLLAAGMGADTLTGLVLMLSRTPLAPGYGGPDVLADQQAAGAIMWFGGDLLMMLLMIVVGVRWSRAAPDDQGLGRWLESARRDALLGPDGASEHDVDQDDAALAAYNARLAALAGRPPAPLPEAPPESLPGKLPERPW